MKPLSLIPFEFEGTLVRTLALPDGPWFVASDVAGILGHREAANMTRNLDADEVAAHNVRSGGQVREMAIISESGLYNAIFRSRRPEAQAFRRWVTSEVLPAIRTGGFYDPAGQRSVAQLKQADRTSRRRELPGLLDRLERERNPEKRRVLHALIERACAAEGIAPPTLDAIGRAASDRGDLVGRFFAALGALDVAGVAWNHSRTSDRIAVSLREVEPLLRQHHQAVAVDDALRDALRTSPRFIKAKTVNSPAAGSAHCWVFEA